MNPQVAEVFLRAADESPQVLFLLGASESYTYFQAADAARRLASRLRARGITRLACHAIDSPRLVLLMLASALTGCEVCVINREYAGGELEPLLARFDFKHLVDDSGGEFPGVTTHALNALFENLGAEQPLAIPATEPRLLVLTTGTTGTPKGAIYTWSNLFAQAKARADLIGTRWLLAYHLNHFAGLQMLVHVVRNRTTMVIPATPEVDSARRALGEHRVEYVSATPTFWRFLLAQTPAEESLRFVVRQITLGGEAVPQDLLALLSERFPDAKVSQVFATTEIGSAFSVRDMSSGLPASLLDRQDDRGLKVKIADGELHVLSTHGMLGYYGEPETSGPVWRATGDLVELRDDRIFFVGRKSETINVGGVKVHPLPVEELAQKVPGVIATHCYGKKNAVTGQIVVLDVLAEPVADRARIEDDIRKACESLSRHAQPRIIRFVEHLETANRKVLRRAQ